MKKVNRIVLICFFFFPLLVSGQDDKQITESFVAAVNSGNFAQFDALLDEQVELLDRGASSSLSKSQARTKLDSFFRSNPPESFVLKHQGSSENGQMYAIAQLVTKKGQNYKVLVRAHSVKSSYKIFRIDFLDR